MTHCGEMHKQIKIGIFILCSLLLFDKVLSTLLHTVVLPSLMYLHAQTHTDHPTQLIVAGLSSHISFWLFENWQLNVSGIQ